MKNVILILILIVYFMGSIKAQKVFDVHIHGNSDPQKQLEELKSAGVYKVAVSTSWSLQEAYKATPEMAVLHGLMLPCPNGKVPYSGQYCFEDQKDFPDIKWVEELVKENKIQFIGEVLSQYYGVSPSDVSLFPYYALAEKHGLPVGIHTGLAGPDHGAPTFKVSLGRPLLVEGLLQKFPKLKVWIMHAGAPFLEETIAIMKYYPNVYADISAINNKYIFPTPDFVSLMKKLIDAGLEDRLMFGSDNGDIKQTMASVHDLEFLSKDQKEKIFFRNAENFFRIGR